MPIRANISHPPPLSAVAKTKGLYTVLSVAERDIRYVTPQATGEMYLLSRPDITIPLKSTTGYW